MQQGLRKILVAVVALSSLAATSISADSKKHVHDHTCSMFPKTNQRFAVRPGTGQISEMHFRHYLNSVAQIYSPIFQRMGMPQLNAIPYWENDDVNAQAWPSEQEHRPGVVVRYSNIRIFGGLARHPQMTPDALILVICHEIGHHLGGFPIYSDGAMSTEGQSDYFAAAKCAREVFGRMTDNDQWFARAQVPLDARNLCQQSFPQDRRQAIVCMRTAVASVALAHILAGPRVPGSAALNFSNRDRNLVPVTYESHPQAQCRLDTYFAGALCQAPMNVPFSRANARQGACTADQRFLRGFRPNCWYADRPLMAVR